MSVRVAIADDQSLVRDGFRVQLGTAGVRVLVLTTFDTGQYVFAALRAGASGFLLKDATPEELLAAIRIVAAGEALLAPAATRHLVADFVSRPAVGPATAKTHVSRILAKLGLRDRAQLVIAAYESGLITPGG